MINSNTSRRISLSSKTGVPSNLQPEKNILAVDENCRQFLYFDHTNSSFRLYDLLAHVHKNPEEYYYTNSFQNDMISPYRKFKRRRSSIFDIENDESSNKQDILKSTMIYSLQPKKSKSVDSLTCIFHSSFLQSFGTTEVSSILQKDEKIEITTVVFYEDVAPMYALGTDQGRVLIFELKFQANAKHFFYFVIDLDSSPVTNLFTHKNMLFASSGRGKFAVYPITLSEWKSTDIENDTEEEDDEGGEEVKDQKKEKQDKCLVPMNITNLGNFQSILSSSLERILQIKVLNSGSFSPHDLDESDLYTKNSSANQQGGLFGLILKNHTVVCFDAEKLKVMFTCIMNDEPVAGLFIHPLQEYFLVLTINGTLNIFSALSGIFERSVELKNYSLALGAQNFLDNYEKAYFDTNKYEYFKKHGSKHFPSSIHGVLEYNTRGQQNKIDYFQKAFHFENHESELHKRYEMIQERVGEISHSKDTILQNPELIWLSHYGNSSLFSNQFTAGGIGFLNLNLSSSYHVIIIDPKQLFENYGTRRIKSSKESLKKESFEKQDYELVVMPDVPEKHRKGSPEQTEFGYALMSDMYPWGVDASIDHEIKKITKHNLPTFDVYYGIQGVGEAFSFLISGTVEPSVDTEDFVPIKSEVSKKFSEIQVSAANIQFHNFSSSSRLSQKNWQASEYLSTVCALSLMVSCALLIVV